MAEGTCWHLIKKKNDKRVHRFRTINLHEADFNLITKTVVTKRTMDTAENGLISDEQWGGRKGKSAGDLELDNLLTIDCSHLTKTPIQMVDLDATACFDRIVRPIGIFSLMTFGFPVEMARWILKTLNNVHYQHIINNKPSSLTYSAVDENLHGYGIGMAITGPSWNATDATIVKEYRKSAPAALLTSPDQTHTITKHSTPFIDYRKL